jgi:hypothetical protein
MKTTRSAKRSAWTSTGDLKFVLSMSMFVGFMVFGLLKLMSGSMTNVSEEQINISYDMPRPKSDLVGEFELGNREVDRQYINPFHKKEAAAVTVKPGSGMEQKKSAKAKPKENKTKTAQNKKTEVNVVDKAQDAIAELINNEVAQQVVINQNFRRAVSSNEVQNQEKDEVLSPQQWRALVLAQPTQKNMDKLVAAVEKKQIEEKEFQEIIHDLLKSQNKDQNTLAFYGINKVATASSFIFISQIRDSLHQDLKPKADQLLASYSNIPKRNELLKVLLAQDVVASLRAAQVVKSAIELALNGQGGVPPSNELRLLSLDSWQKFATVFQRWAGAANADQRGIAAEILRLLPTRQSSVSV